MKELKKNIYEVYSEGSEMTIIMEDTYIEEPGYENQIISSEVKGFYFGEPNPENTIKFHGSLKAEY